MPDPQPQAAPPTTAPDLSAQIGQARQNGYSDDQIAQYLSSKRSDLAPKISEAMQSGHSASDVVNYLATKTAPGSPALNSDVVTPIAQARKDRVSDDEILDYIGRFKPDLVPGIKEARAAGKDSTDILNQLAGTPGVKGASPQVSPYGPIPNGKIPGLTDFAQGVLHGAVKTVGDLLGHLPGEVGHEARDVVSAYPSNDSLAAKIGNFAEQAGEMSIGGGAGEKLALKAAPFLSKYLPSIAKILPYVGQAAGSAATAGVESGGDPAAMAEAAVPAVALPAAGAGIKAGAKALLEKALASPSVNRLAQTAQDFAASNSIPLNQGAISGSRAVQAAEKTLGETVAPDKYAALIDAQQQGMNRAAQDFVGAKPASQYEAGQEVLDLLDGKLKDTHQAAQDAYAKFDQAVAAHPATVPAGTKASSVLDAQGHPVLTPTTQTVNLPVDVSQAKKALRPVYNKIAGLLSRIPEASREQDPGFRVLSRLMNGPDQIPASDAEEILSLSKNIGREATFPEVRNRSQGIASLTNSVLQPAIDKGVANAGPEAIKALRSGRQLWAQKSALADLMEKLGGSDQTQQVSAFKKLLAPKDSNFDTLQQVLETAPEAAEALRRGYLTNLFEKPSEKGGFSNARGALAEWQKLGSQTRQAIFGADQGRDIDVFLKLAQRLGENPNPSGTGTVNALLKLGLVVTHPATGVPALVFGRKLADLLYSPEGARNLRALVTMGPRSRVGRQALSMLSTAIAEKHEGQPGAQSLSGPE